MEGATAAVRRWVVTVLLATAVAAGILHPLWRPGYVLLVDLVFGPRPAPVRGDFSAPVGLVQATLTTLLGGQWGGRLLLLATMTLCLVAPVVMVRTAPWYARAIAGLLATFNPWVYARLVEGQFGVIAAAAMLFLCVDAARRLVARPGPRTAAYLALASCAMVAFDPHFGPMLAAVGAIAAASSKPWRAAGVWPWVAAAAGPIAILGLVEALPFFAGDGHNSYRMVAGFGRADFAVFRSSADPVFGLVPGLVGLQGYWAERLSRFPAAMAGAPWWPLSWGIVVLSALAGAAFHRAHRWVLVAGLAGLGVSASTALPGGVDTAAWLAARIPLLAAYREPEKWSALWLLALVILTVDLVEEVRRRGMGSVSSRAAAPALAYLMGISIILPGGVGVLAGIPTVIKPAEYPSDWASAGRFLRDEVPAGSLVVVLPWHAYERLGFVDGRLVSNPAAVYFGGRLLVPDDIEIAGRLTDDLATADLATASVGRPMHRCALADAVRARGARWVVVEPTEGAASNLSDLQACGFSVRIGGAGRVSVLRA